METNANQRILGQITLWTIIGIVIPLIVTVGQLPSGFVPRAIVIIGGINLMIILNIKVFFPRFYIHSSFRKYIFIGLLAALSISISFRLIIELFCDISSIRPSSININKNIARVLDFIGGSVPLLVAFFGSTMYEIAIIAKQSTQEAALLKSEKLEAELKFLKSQINPHFLFNSLNNIYTLTVLDPDLAGKNLLKLSEMLRYLLYECNSEKVQIGRELTYLRNYIELFSLKDDEALNIVFDAKDVQEEIYIAPLLLIPFVENAFKHSQIEDLEKGWIKINLLGDQEQVYFEVRNSVPDVEFSKDEVGGIGLQNVQRQLELLYPNKHRLKIEQTATEFSIYLTLYL